jgi:hypothetical protein
MPHTKWDDIPSLFRFPNYYGVQASYSRIDYLILNLGMAREWNTEQSFNPTLANWGITSDPRPLPALFTMDDK